MAVKLHVVTGMDGSTVIQIDTDEGDGNVRVWLNDNMLYNADPEKD